MRTVSRYICRKVMWAQVLNVGVRLRAVLGHVSKLLREI